MLKRSNILAALMLTTLISPAAFGEESQVRLESVAHPVIRSLQDVNALRELHENGGFFEDRSSQAIDTGFERPAERRLGTFGPAPERVSPHEETDGFRDPLEGHRNQRHRSTLVTPGSIPSSDSTTGYSDTIDFEDGGKMVITGDTRTTYDAQGRVESVSTIERSPEGNTVRTETADGHVYEEHYDSQGNQLYNTETTVPRPSNTTVDPDSSAGGAVPGGGWYNPITGQYSPGAGLRVRGDHIRPSEDPREGVAQDEPLIDQADLVTNPDPSVYEGQARPTTITPDGGRIVNPGPIK